MTTNRIKANICGTSYMLTSEEPLSYMRDLVAQIDMAMTEIIEGDSRMSTTMAAVLTALDNADKANKEQRTADQLRLEMKRAIDEQERLRDELSDTRAEAARLRQENVQLRAHAPAKS